MEQVKHRNTMRYPFDDEFIAHTVQKEYFSIIKHTKGMSSYSPRFLS